MTAARGTLSESTACLPDWVSADVPTRSDSEEQRIALMYSAALAAHYKAAIAKVSRNSEVSEAERSESRRVLTSLCEPWASTRRWLCEAAELDERHVMRAALAVIAPMTAAERAAEPSKPKFWSAAEFLNWVVANEAGLRELGELDAAIEEAARRELAERQQPMAQKRPASRATRYIAADISAVPAE